MKEVSGPIVAIALVLCAVFVPTAFIVGLSGEFYKQFALTIAVSTIISAFNSLTLSPALAALLLKPRVKGNHQALPGLAFALLGGGLAWEWLTPLLGVQSFPGTWLTWSVVLGGAGLGFLVGRPMNWLLGLAFRL